MKIGLVLAKLQQVKFGAFLGIQALSFSKQQLNQLNVCWNRAYRKAFHMRSWESVKELQA